MLKKVLSVLLLALFPGLTFAEEAAIHIRLSTQLSPDSELIQSIIHFKERVKAESHGSISIEIFDAGKLFDSNAIVAGLSAGKVEMGQANLTRYASAVPIADAYSLPFLFSDETVERASRQPGASVRKIVDAAILERTGTRVLWWIPEGSFVVLSKEAPLLSPDALAGKRVRSNGPTIAKTLEACGGNPIDIPSLQQYEAYASGRVDAAMTSIGAVVMRKLFEPMRTITRTNQATFNDVVAVNETFWRSLSEAQRIILLSAAAAADREASESLVRFERDVYSALEKEGVKVVTVSTSDLMLWRICSSDILSDFIAGAGASGQKLMAAYAKLLQDPCCNRMSRTTLGAN
jgi:C4-dicarboxylate-binding protein DctP